MTSSLHKGRNLKHWRWLLWIALFILQSCAIAGSTEPSASKLVEAALNYQLPESVSDVHYQFKNLGDDVTWWWKYIKFKAPREVYDNLLVGLGYESYLHTRSLARFAVPGGLGIPYSLRSELNLDWWNVTIEFEDSIAVKEYGKNGRSIAKYENGYVYIVIHDHEP